MMRSPIRHFLWRAVCSLLLLPLILSCGLDPTNTPKSKRMRGLLAQAEALHEARVPIDTVSFMADLARYYQHGGSDVDRARSYYVMGCASRDRDDDEMAMLCFEIAQRKLSSAYSAEGFSVYKKVEREIGLIRADSALVLAAEEGEDTAALSKALRDYRRKAFRANGRSLSPPGSSLYDLCLGIYYNGVGTPVPAIACFQKTIRDTRRVRQQKMAYGGLMASYRFSGDADSLYKYALLFAKASDSIANASSVADGSRMESLAKLRDLAQGKVERRIHWRMVIILSLMLLIVAAGLFLRQRRKALGRASNARKRYSLTLRQYHRTTRELEAAKRRLESLEAEKQEEVKHLQAILSSYKDNYNEDDWSREQTLMQHETIEHVRKQAGRGQALTGGEWSDMESTVEKLMPEYYAKLAAKQDALTACEFQVCLLIRFHFKPGDIAALLGLSQQRVSNIRSDINRKLFRQKGTRGLEAHLNRL